MPDEEALKGVTPAMARVKKAKPMRTTFSLTEHGLQSLSWLAERWDTQREVFEQIASGVNIAADEALLSELLRSQLLMSGKSTRRTVVINRQDLQTLTRFAKQQGLQRDEAINKLLILKHAAEEIHRRGRNERQRRVIALWDEIVSKAAGRFEEEASAILKNDPDDPVFRHFQFEIAQIEIMGINLPADDGEPIDEVIT